MQTDPVRLSFGTHKVSIPILVDVGMVLALIALSYWTGTEAQQVQYLNQNVQNIQIRLNTLTNDKINAEIAAMQVHSDDQDKQLLQMQTFIGARLDRIERKLDNIR